MEDKGLNFGHPLHSTRPLPSYKSELNSGPLCSPGTVPFGWEKTPGMPKFPALTDSRDSSFEDCITEEEDDPTTATSTCLEDEDEDDDDGDGGVVYSDAPEELSRTESFFFNCSLGGISGFEEGADARPLGFMSGDPKVQDLMMGRFLPAAQAMAAETPTHVGRKQTTRVEETSHVSRVRNAPVQLRYWECRPDLSPNYAPELYSGVETENEDEDEDRDSSILEDRPMRGCWFLRRFCIKAPFCITNGVPAPNLKAAYHINKVHNASSNEVLTKI
ncbi:hypothetical protein MLD38_009198 [Melastoma candidum]|uniref:Uncharacterized protein n=1 Tax=Melastoma candidum TaxID=119954 RepID=A0ACB9RY67_9MYRT|nr:hypothetical protein MLD38_009198 [Melastoma candidum]